MSEGFCVSELRRQWCQMRLLLKPWSRDFDQDQLCSISPGSPHILWRSFYRRWTSTSEPTMTFDKEGKKSTDTLRWPGASKKDSTRRMSRRSITPAQVKTWEVIHKGINTTLNHQEHNKAPSGHQPQEAEEEKASEEDSACNQECCFACSVEKIRGIQQGHVKSRYRSKRK
jgi:hypothetical protein